MKRTRTELVNAAHAPVLARLHAAAFPQHQAWDALALEKLLRTPGFSALLAWRGEEPAGFILYRRAADEGEIITLAIAPPERRRGLASRLVSVALADMNMGGARRVFLEVADDNTAAIALYEKAGFASAGRRRNYYTAPNGRKTDAVILMRAFGGGCGG